MPEIARQRVCTLFAFGQQQQQQQYSDRTSQQTREHTDKDIHERHVYGARWRAVFGNILHIKDFQRDARNRAPARLKRCCCCCLWLLRRVCVLRLCVLLCALCVCVVGVAFVCGCVRIYTYILTYTETVYLAYRIPSLYIHS